MSGGNLNLSGFTGQPDNADWLYQLGDTLQKNKFFDERAAERRQSQQDKEEGRQASNAEFFTNYLNKKDHLTGTNYDPVKNDLINEALNQAYTLSSQKVPLPNILQAVGPLVDKLNQYDAKAKMYTANQSQWMTNMKGVNGYDVNKIKQLADQKAFYDIDPKTGQPVLNVDKADPSHDYYTDIIKENPDLVTNSSGIEDLVNKYKPDITTNIVKRTNAKGGFEYRKTKVSANPYMTVDSDGEVVPRYELARDGDKIVTHPFSDGKGGVTHEPVRMIPEDQFESMLSSKEGMATADWLKGQLKQAGDSTDFKNTQSNHAARALLYTELKNRTPIHYEDVDNQKENPIHYSNNFYANQNQPQQVIDLYNGDKNNKGVKEIVSDNESKGYGYTRFNQLPVSAQNVILKITKESSGDKELNYSNLYVNSLPTGEIVVRKVPDNGKIMPDDIKDGKYLSIIDPQSLNIPVNINATKVGTGKTKAETINKVIDTGNKSEPNKTYNIKGKSYSHSELLKGGWTENQINQAVKSGKIK